MKEFQLYDVPYYDDFYAMVTGSARLYGSRPALVQYDRKGGASQWTYCQLQADVLALADQTRYPHRFHSRERKTGYFYSLNRRSDMLTEAELRQVMERENEK